MSKLKIFILLIFVSLIGGYSFLTRADKVNWVEDAILHDGRSVNVQRQVSLTYSAGGEISNLGHKWPHYYSFKVLNPDKGELIEWKGDYGFYPILLDFIGGVPYLVILQDDVFADLKQYGCPDIPYVFFRYDTNRKHWVQVSATAFPPELSHANLTASFDFNTQEGAFLSKEGVAGKNKIVEGAMSGGYFSNTIPKNFDSWDYHLKDDHKRAHYKDGCRPAQPNLDSLLPKITSQNVVLEILEKKDYKPEWVIKGDSVNQFDKWDQIAWDKDRDAKCDTFLKQEYPGSALDIFIQDTTSHKRVRFPSFRICEFNAIWLGDYSSERGRMILSKYTPMGDLVYKISFEKPAESFFGYAGGIMQPTFKAENGYLTFEWWNDEQSGWDRKVERTIKARIKEPSPMIH